jgi:hypothetical protein
MQAFEAILHTPGVCLIGARALNLWLANYADGDVPPVPTHDTDVIVHGARDVAQAVARRISGTVLASRNPEIYTVVHHGRGVADLVEQPLQVIARVCKRTLESNDGTRVQVVTPACLRTQNLMRIYRHLERDVHTDVRKYVERARLLDRHFPLRVRTAAPPNRARLDAVYLQVTQQLMAPREAVLIGATTDALPYRGVHVYSSERIAALTLIAPRGPSLADAWVDALPEARVDRRTTSNPKCTWLFAQPCDVVYVGKRPVLRVFYYEKCNQEQPVPHCMWRGWRVASLPVLMSLYFLERFNTCMGDGETQKVLALLCHVITGEPFNPACWMQPHACVPSLDEYDSTVDMCMRL